ncbi:hypothetical protein GS504_15915 [Rhodococcus hoagii]|nr:hypothetical protein [Prescottella equi]
MTATLLVNETALEDEAHQRNTQTVADFPPGTCVLLAHDTRRWIVDSRSADGLVLTWFEDSRIQFLPAAQLWRIDPICQEAP